MADEQKPIDYWFLWVLPPSQLHEDEDIAKEPIICRTREDAEAIVAWCRLAGLGVQVLGGHAWDDIDYVRRATQHWRDRLDEINGGKHGELPDEAEEGG